MPPLPINSTDPVVVSVLIPRVDKTVSVPLIHFMSTSLLPASWVRAANRVPVRSGGDVPRDYYRRPSDINTTAQIGVSLDVGAPLHEFMHHVQFAAPQLDDLFQSLHRRRTAGDKRIRVGAPGELGREDDYILSYFGREYGPSELPLEILPMAVQSLFFRVLDKDRLVKLIRKDPEMLDLIIGALLRYDP